MPRQPSRNRSALRHQIYASSLTSFRAKQADAFSSRFTSRDRSACVGRNLSALFLNGKRGISPEMAVRLSKVFGGSAASWLTQQAHYDLAQIPANRINLKRLQFA